MSFSKTLARVAPSVFLFLSTVTAQKVEFVPVQRNVIEARLQEAENDNAKRGRTLRKIFEEAGCRDPQLVDQPVKGSRLPNLVCTLPGSDDSVILVGAHYDHTKEGMGMADNWSGAALLPSLYQSLGGVTRKHTFVFIGFTDEEKGLVGSRFYSKQLTAEQKAKTRAMVNLDTLGLSFTKVWRNRADPKLVNALASVANSMDLALQGVNVEQVGSSDSEPFSQKKIPSITIHSVTQETYPLLHTDKDTHAAMNLPEYYNTYRLLAAYLAFLDTTLE